MSDINYIWASKYRPIKFDDFIIQKSHREDFLSYKRDLQIPNLLFLGPPGIGKTTLAKIIVKDILDDCDYLYINASDTNSVDVVRNEIMNFATKRGFNDGIKVIILDEFDGFLANAQKILRNVMEENSAHCRFILTGNYHERIIEPIRSRCISYDLLPNNKDIIKRVIKILKDEKVNLTPEAPGFIKQIIERHAPDMRSILNAVQKLSITGTLMVTDKTDFDSLIEEVYNTLIEDTPNLIKLRTLLIHKEEEFERNYNRLLRELAVYIRDQAPEWMPIAVIKLNDALYKMSGVVDIELHTYATLLEIKMNIKVK